MDRRFSRRGPVVIIGGGPSITTADVEATRGLPVVAVNNAYQIAPWAEINYACDYPWWKEHPAAVDKGHTVSKEAVKHFPLQRWPLRNEPGLDPARRSIHHGGTSGYQAICLAVNLGARCIVLLGFDCQKTDRLHWHPDHANQKPQPYDTWIKNFATLAESAKCMGIEIINCSRETALTCFPRSTIDRFLHGRARPGDTAAA